MDINEALEIINRWSKPGGIVMDLFCGTMVIGLAALRLNRIAIMSDIDADVVKLGRERMERFYRWNKMNGVLPPLGMSWNIHIGYI